VARQARRLLRGGVTTSARRFAVRVACVTETYPPEVNGVALTVERSIRHLQARHDVQVIRPRQADESPRDDKFEWRTAGAPIPVYRDLRFGWATVGTLRARWSAAQPDLVHVVTPGPLGRAAILAANSLGVPLTTDFRANFHWYCRYYGLGWAERPVCRFLRALHNRADCTFVPTRAAARELGDEGFERLEVLGRGVDAALFSPEQRSESLRASWGVRAGDPPVMLYVGRLAVEKNVELALRAHERLRIQRPDAKLVVVGDGPLRPTLQARYPQALFAGTLHGRSLAAHYASADLMLFPSESETFGNVTLEGLASGLEVVAFDAAAAAELITDGDNGWLVPVGAHEGFLATAVRVGLGLAAPGSRQALRERARARALQVTWDQVLDHFDRRLSHHARAADPRSTHEAVVA
jgi:glycosyltransferase involved in cell wall biosynthesis